MQRHHLQGDASERVAWAVSSRADRNFGPQHRARVLREQRADAREHLGRSHHDSQCVARGRAGVGSLRRQGADADDGRRDVLGHDDTNGIVPYHRYNMLTNRTRRATPRCRSAFTLFEVLVSVALVAVLGAVIYPTVMSRVRSSVSSSLMQTLVSLSQSIAEYKRAVTHYPGSLLLLTT